MQLLGLILLSGSTGFLIGEATRSYGKKNKWSEVRTFTVTCILSVIAGLSISNLFL